MQALIVQQIDILWAVTANAYAVQTLNARFDPEISNLDARKNSSTIQIVPLSEVGCSGSCNFRQNLGKKMVSQNGYEQRPLPVCVMCANWNQHDQRQAQRLVNFQFGTATNLAFGLEIHGKVAGFGYVKAFGKYHPFAH